MLVRLYKEIENGRMQEVYCDTDDLSDEDYAEFRRLWDSNNMNDKLKAKRYLYDHI